MKKTYLVQMIPLFGRCESKTLDSEESALDYASRTIKQTAKRGLDCSVVVSYFDEQGNNRVVLDVDVPRYVRGVNKAIAEEEAERD